MSSDQLMSDLRFPLSAWSTKADVCVCRTKHMTRSLSVSDFGYVMRKRVDSRLLRDPPEGFGPRDLNGVRLNLEIHRRASVFVKDIGEPLRR